MSVSVVIPVFNQARFLPDAIRSVLGQTAQIIVVDDGSTEDIAAVASQFPSVTYLRQANAGPSAARNRGLGASESEFVVFLDADDRLLPRAIEAGVTCAREHPDCAFVYGGHRLVFGDWAHRAPDKYMAPGSNGYHSLLCEDIVGTPAAAMFRRRTLVEAGGWNEAYRFREDYELYLRLARSSPIAGHPAIVAEYRSHGASASSNHIAMLRSGLEILDRERSLMSDEAAIASYRRGRWFCRDHYVREILIDARVRWSKQRSIPAALASVALAVAWGPVTVLRVFAGKMRA